MIVAATGLPLAIEYDPSKPSIDTSLFLDCRKANEELAWWPRTSLEEGIRHTLAWWKVHIGASKLDD